MKTWVVFTALFSLAIAIEPSTWEDIVQSRVDAQHKAIQRLTEMLGQAVHMADREEMEESASDTETDIDASQESTEKDDKDDSDEKSISFPNVFSILRTTGYKPWWQGSNVCVERAVKEEGNETEEIESYGGFFTIGSAQFSSCKHTPHKYICTTILKKNGKTTTTTVTYQCCAGYTRSQTGPGCEKYEIKSIEDAGKEMGAGKFASLLKEMDIEGDNTTIFLPLDDAVDLELMDSNKKNAIETNDVLETLKELEILPTPPSTKQHVVPGTLVHTYDFVNNLLLTTIGGNQLRVNVYPFGIVTVNCVELGKSVDVMTDKGVAHTVNALIPTTQLSLMDHLTKREYSMFYDLLKRNNLLEELKGEGPFTVFALTDSVMEKVYTSDRVCMQKILKHHILPHFLCSAPTKAGNVSAIDLASDWVVLKRTESGLLLDNNVLAKDVDILATNGLIYNVDNFIIPSKAVSLSQLLKRSNHTGVLDLLKKAQLLNELNSRENLTLLIPAEETLAPLTDLPPAELKEQLLYHLIDGKRDSWAFKDKSKVSTAEGGDLYVRLYRNLLSFDDPKPTFNCVPVTRQNGYVCNGVVHEIARPVTKPSKSMYDLIQTDPELALMKRLIEGTDLEDGLKLGVFKETTILALPNDFEETEPEATKKLLEDKELANRSLRKRMLTQALCCSTVGVSNWPFTSTVQTLTPNRLVTNRRGDDVFIGPEKVRRCDMVATDGLIHIMEKRAGSKGSRGDTEVIFQQPHSEVILGGFDFN